MDDILNDLIIADGMEKPAKKKAVKKTQSKSAPTKKKPVAVEPVSKKPKYSVAELNTKDTAELKKICGQLGISVSRRKVELIKNILDNT
tara:strand:- start:178 stop:444 length:267 start_codon:yes stop_codon:yes gene_type:complete